MSRILSRMKTTIDLDEAKLKNVMKLTGIKTRKAAVDYALAEVERKARLAGLMSRPCYVAEGPAMDPTYDLSKLRDADRPRNGKKGGRP
jgi:2-hydroxychromene-2-carboxylate isomerase